MRARVYIETSIISYLAARPSRDLVTAARQQITHAWWRSARSEFDLFGSQLVDDEAAAGDPEVAALRMSFVADLPKLAVTPEVIELAADLRLKIPLPPKAGADAFHIAIGACHGIEILLTWNCKHIANARLRSRIEHLCRINGFKPPVLCTPDELMNEDPPQ